MSKAFGGRDNPLIQLSSRRSLILKYLPQRRDLATWYLICKDTHHDLQEHCKLLVRNFHGKHGRDSTHSDFRTSSPEIFDDWMKAKPRKDDVIMKQSHFQKHKGESRDEEKIRKRNARLVLRHVRDYIGDDRFVKFFETSVKDGMVWAMDVVSALSKDDEDDDDNDDDHKFALHLERVALETLKARGRRLHEDDDHISSISRRINEWAVEHRENLQKTKFNTLAAARSAKSMLEYWLADEKSWDTYVRNWANNCLASYFHFSLWSIVKSGDEGELADSMLEIIKRRPDYHCVQDWADRCFNLYARLGMPVHAIRFAHGMLETIPAYGSDTAGLSSKWKERCLSQGKKQALWEKAGDLAQVMLRVYLECGNLCESLPQSLQISKEKQLGSVAYGSQQPEFRLLKKAGPENFELAFPEKLPQGLLNNVQAQAQILESVTRATRNANDRPIHGKNIIGELRSAIESWKTNSSGDAIGVYQNRKSTNPTYNV
jgi:hypothetical protein